MLFKPKRKIITTPLLHQLCISYDGKVIMRATGTRPRPTNSQEALEMLKELVRIREAEDMPDTEVLGKYSIK